MNQLIRSAKANQEIIKMMEEYIELYNTLDFRKWLYYGEKQSCRMCRLVGIERDGETDCHLCPLSWKGPWEAPCMMDDDDTGWHLETLILDMVGGAKRTKQLQRKTVKARIKFLYNRLKSNGYFN